MNTWIWLTQWEVVEEKKTPGNHAGIRRNQCNTTPASHMDSILSGVQSVQQHISSATRFVSDNFPLSSLYGKKHETVNYGEFPSFHAFPGYSSQKRMPVTYHFIPISGLFVPSQLSTSPPSYEEALKHKVILSSYQPTGPPPGPLPAYTLPPPDVSRQYQTLPANSSSSSSAFILNPNGPNASAIRISTMSGHRSLPLPQTENYAGLPTSHYPICTQHLYSGTVLVVLNPGDCPDLTPRKGSKSDLWWCSHICISNYSYNKCSYNHNKIIPCVFFR